MSMDQTERFDLLPYETEEPPPALAAWSTGILLSTRWDQNGIIISIGSNTTIRYNEYTPFDPLTSPPVHSLTGCTNTAAAQIIYHYIEKKGLALSLTLRDDDAYESVKGNVTISVAADGSTPGTISFAAVNGYLTNYAPDSAEHAAALLYACGVVQKAHYSSSGTSTAWSTDLFYRAGFQSVDRISMLGVSTAYYWGTTDASGNATLSDAGFEVLIENLQAGRPVGTSYPGHALVIDGYDSESDRFHINFGWGKNGATNWYSREDIRERGYYEFVYDLMTERVETLTVTDGRTYGTGTMVRAFEQARSIEGSNTVLFAASVAGRAVELTEYIKMRESTTVRGFNMTAAVIGARNFSWGVAFYGENGSSTRFEDFGGALIVNTPKSTNAALYFASADALSFSARGALLYAGNYAPEGDHAAGAAAVLSALRTARDDLTELDDLVTGAAGYSFYGTSGDDAIVLAGRSLAVGTAYLLGGNDTVTLSGDSRLYGSISGSGNKTVTVTGRSRLCGNLNGSDGKTITVTNGSRLYGNLNGTNTITVDSTSEVAGLIYASTDLRLVLDSVPEDHALFRIESNVYNLYSNAAVSVDIAEAEVGTYTLIAAAEGASYADWLYRMSLTVTGTGGSDHTLCGTGTTTSEYADLICENGMLKLNVKRSPSEALPKVVSVWADLLTATTQSVTVYADFSSRVAAGQYSLDGSTWRPYAGGVSMDANGTVYFRGVDETGHLSKVKEYEVTNIIAAPIPAATAPEVILTITDPDHDCCGATGGWKVQSDQTVVWQDLTTLGAGYAYLGLGCFTAGKAMPDIYVYNAGAAYIAAYITDDTGAVTGFETAFLGSGTLNQVGLADFDADGVSDLLLRTAEGFVGYYADDAFHEVQGLGLEWSVAALGDVDGNGCADVVIAHEAGYVGAYLVGADGSISWADLGNLDGNTQIVGAGDVNGDGTDDVIVQVGANYYGAWLCGQGAVTGFFGIGEFDAAVQDVADFNADGTADLLLRTASGVVGAALITAADTTSWAEYGALGAEWSTKGVGVL